MLCTPFIKDLLLVFLEKEFTAPRYIVNYMIKSKFDELIKQGYSTNKSLEEISLATKLSKYKLLKRIQELDEIQKDPKEKELLSRLIT